MELIVYPYKFVRDQHTERQDLSTTSPIATIDVVAVPKKGQVLTAQGVRYFARYRESVLFNIFGQYTQQSDVPYLVIYRRQRSALTTSRLWARLHDRAQACVQLTSCSVRTNTWI